MLLLPDEGGRDAARNIFVRPFDEGGRDEEKRRRAEEGLVVVVAAVVVVAWRRSRRYV